MKNFARNNQRLLGLSAAVNAFTSEAVQVKVISWLLKRPQILFKEDAIEEPQIIELPEPKRLNTIAPRSNLKKSTSQVVNEILKTNFFDTPHTLTDITNFCNEHYEGNFYPNGVSSALLNMISSSKLSREKNEQLKRFVYQKPAK